MPYKCALFRGTAAPLSKKTLYSLKSGFNRSLLLSDVLNEEQLVDRREIEQADVVRRFLASIAIFDDSICREILNDVQVKPEQFEIRTTKSLLFVYFRYSDAHCFRLFESICVQVLA